MRTGELTTALDLEDLARRVSTWDEKAVEDFSRIFGPRLRSYFLWRGLGSWDAEDLSVTCVSTVVTKIEMYKPKEGGGFEAWVSTIARNAANDWWRKRRREEPLPEDYDAASKEDEKENEAVLVVQEAVAQLSENDQHVIALRHFQELSYEEVSAALGVTPEAARTRYCRAMQRLTSKLENDPRASMWMRPAGSTEVNVKI